MQKKTKIIGIRIDEDTDARLEAFERQTGVERVTLARNAMVAALNYYEEAGRISFPLVLVEPGNLGAATAGPGEVSRSKSA